MEVLPCTSPASNLVDLEPDIAGVVIDETADAIVRKVMRQEKRPVGRGDSGRAEVRPTPIWISKRTRTMLLLGGVVALVALFESPTTALLTTVLFLVIQPLEGNVLTPRIQEQTLQIPSVMIFLAVIAGGEIAGLLGAIVAVPVVAVLKELFDFFRARLRTRS